MFPHITSYVRPWSYGFTTMYDRVPMGLLLRMVVILQPYEFATMYGCDPTNSPLCMLVILWIHYYVSFIPMGSPDEYVFAPLWPLDICDRTD